MNHRHRPNPRRHQRQRRNHRHRIESDGEESSDEGASVERISGGHRDGLIVVNTIIGDPDAPVLISEYGDPF